MSIVTGAERRRISEGISTHNRGCLVHPGCPFSQYYRTPSRAQSYVTQDTPIVSHPLKLRNLEQHQTRHCLSMGIFNIQTVAMATSFYANQNPKVPVKPLYSCQNYVFFLGRTQQGKKEIRQHMSYGFFCIYYELFSQFASKLECCKGPN